MSELPEFVLYELAGRLRYGPFCVEIGRDKAEQYLRALDALLLERLDRENERRTAP